MLRQAGSRTRAESTCMRAPAAVREDTHTHRERTLRPMGSRARKEGACSARAPASELTTRVAHELSRSEAQRAPTSEWRAAHALLAHAAEHKSRHTGTYGACCCRAAATHALQAHAAAGRQPHTRRKRMQPHASCRTRIPSACCGRRPATHASRAHAAVDGWRHTHRWGACGDRRAAMPA